MKADINLNKLKSELIFIPLGGSGEIGMNLNLYHINGKWIIVDLGLGFANNEDLPGIDIIVPNINFIINKIKKDVLGIILTHAHEDHIGAIQYLWSEIGCPIYATKLTSFVVQSKCDKYSLKKQIKFIEVMSNTQFSLNDFKITMIPITHSIPEMHGLFIETDRGCIFHTGDWNFDNEPVVGSITDEDNLKRIGDKGVLALVGDSTNIFHKKRFKSEGDLGRNLKVILGKYTNNLVLVTTFASNIARLVSLIKAAKYVGRKVILQGRSLWNMYTAAKQSGYLDDIVVYNEKYFKKYKRNEILLICTGCQGEALAATAKIANKTHPQISLKENDVVIFSSKIIPGNERKIYNLFNRLAEMNVRVLNEENEFVHVSGHPSVEEVVKMFKLIRPEISIPVHGEAVHLNEHCRVAQQSGVKQTISVRNGDVVLLKNKQALKIAEVESGYYMIDGNLILDSESTIVKDRVKLMKNGALFVSISINKEKKSLNCLNISSPGLLEANIDKDFIDDIKQGIINSFQDLDSIDQAKVQHMTETSVKKNIKKLLNKSPLIVVDILYDC